MSERGVHWLLVPSESFTEALGRDIGSRGPSASPLPPSVPLGLAAQLASQALGPELRSKLQGPPSHPAHLRYLTALPWEPPPTKHWPPN